jgi:hypothetical protein
MNKELYEKDENGNFILIGYKNYDIDNPPKTKDGIWLIKNNEYSKSKTSLSYMLGDIPLIDVKYQPLLFNYMDKLTRYLLDLSNEESDVYKEAKIIEGGYLKGGLCILNWSRYSLALMILREMGKWIKQDLNKQDDGKI